MLTTANKLEMTEFSRSFQAALAQAICDVDGSAEVQWKPWQRAEGGGGLIGLIRGQVVEKAGVNFSEVMGDHYPAIDPKAMPEAANKPFYATGVSTITHMMNPYAPIGHMNVRLISAGDDFWFGGGGDLTPMHAYPEDTELFHAALKKACLHLRSNPRAYEEFSRACDEYFYIPHRKSIRGVGGIFFDYLRGDFAELLTFVQEVAMAYKNAYCSIIDRRKSEPFQDADKEAQLYWRGRYAEFNLAYDRGTRFGLMTGGNPDAIFVSLPPVVKW